MKERKKESPQIIYYTNELEDEFSEAVIAARKIDGSYNYEGSFFRKIGRGFWYFCLAKPLAFLFLKLKFRHKIINKDCMKSAGKQGFFLYGNHTNAIADALIPTMVGHPASVYVIVHANNVSMPVLGKITPSLGALPLPDDKEAVKHFNTAISNKITAGKCITIYPEAHIWPYYTKIRPFKDSSFRYPVQYNAPVYCFTNTYHKRKYSKTPQIVTYVDGPFYSDKTFNSREQRQQLRNQVYDIMCERSKNNNVELVQYIKKEE